MTDSHTLRARFYERFIPEPNTGCWLWTAAAYRNGAKGGKTNPGQQGERNHKAKLTSADVRSIRERHRAGASVASLASEYGLRATAIYRVVSRETWRHV